VHSYSSSRFSESIRDSFGTLCGAASFRYVGEHRWCLRQTSSTGGPCRARLTCGMELPTSSTSVSERKCDSRMTAVVSSPPILRNAEVGATPTPIALWGQNAVERVSANRSAECSKTSLDGWPYNPTVLCPVLSRLLPLLKCFLIVSKLSSARLLVIRKTLRSGVQDIDNLRRALLANSINNFQCPRRLLNGCASDISSV